MFYGTLVDSLFIAGINQKLLLKNAENTSFRIVKNIQILSPEVNAQRQRLRKQHKNDPKYDSLFKSEKVQKLGKSKNKKLFKRSCETDKSLSPKKDSFSQRIVGTNTKSIDNDENFVDNESMYNYEPSSPTKGQTEYNSVYLRIQYYNQEYDPLKVSSLYSLDLMTAEEYNNSTDEIAVVQYYTTENINKIEDYFDMNLEGEFIPLNAIVGIKKINLEQRNKDPDNKSCNYSDKDMYLTMGYFRAASEGSINDIAVIHHKPSSSPTNKKKDPKVPYSYSHLLDFSLSFQDGLRFLAIKKRENPFLAKFKSDVIECYPPSKKSLAQNALAVVFPHGINMGLNASHNYSCCAYLMDEESYDYYTVAFYQFRQAMDKKIESKIQKMFKIKTVELYSDIAIGTIGKCGDLNAYRRVIEIFYRSLYDKANLYPIERLACNLVDEIPLFGNKQTEYHIDKGNFTVEFYEKCNTLSESCLRNLFRTLSLENIAKMYFAAILENSIYIISNNMALNFDIIETITKLIYPFKWNFPKITNFETCPDFIDSPMPIIYSILQSNFNINEYIDNGLDYSDKIFVMLESDEIRTINGYELIEVPKNQKKQQLKRLEKYKKYSKYYAKEADRNYWNHNRTAQGDDIEIVPQLDFNYWDIRDAFFELNQWLMQDYQEFLLNDGSDIKTSPRGKNVNSSPQKPEPSNVPLLDENSIFSGQATHILNVDLWLKKRAHKKSYLQYMTQFTKTTIFSNFIEKRVLNANTSNQNKDVNCWLDFFDKSYTLKRNKKKPNILCYDNLILNEHIFKCLQPVTYDLPEPNVKTYGYDGVGSWDHNLFVESDSKKIFQQRSGDTTLLNENKDNLKTILVSVKDDDDWVEVQIIQIYEIWAILFCKFLMKNYYTDTESKFNELILNVCALMDKRMGITEIFQEKIVFAQGLVKCQKSLEDVLRIYSKNINDLKIKPRLMNIFIEGNKKSIRLKKKEEENIKKEEELLLLRVPLSITSHFELKNYCPKCGIDIPEEIQFTLFAKQPDSYKITCPNQKCYHKFETFITYCFFKLGHNTDEKMDTQRIIPPFTLKDKIESGDDTWASSQSDVYINAVFYFKLFHLPCFWLDGNIVEQKINPVILKYSMAMYFPKKNDGIDKAFHRNNSSSMTTFSSVQKVFTKQKTRDITFKSTHHTNSKEDENESDDEQKIRIDYKTRLEKFNLIIQYKFSRFIHKNFTQQFADLLNYNKHYDTFSKFSSYIIEMQDFNEIPNKVEINSGELKMPHFGTPSIKRNSVSFLNQSIGNENFTGMDKPPEENDQQGFSTVLADLDFSFHARKQQIENSKIAGNMNDVSMISINESQKDNFSRRSSFRQVLQPQVDLDESNFVSEKKKKQTSKFYHEHMEGQKEESSDSFGY